MLVLLLVLLLVLSEAVLGSARRGLIVSERAWLRCRTFLVVDTLAIGNVTDT
jgi:hypothetical protein